MFFVSGAASLIYQIIWIRKFSLVLGGTVFSMSVVISTFMAGIAIGAAVLGRLADRVKAPLMLYAAIELAIGASAIVLKGDLVFCDERGGSGETKRSTTINRKGTQSAAPLQSSAATRHARKSP